MARLQLIDEVAWEGDVVPGERTRALLRALADAGPRGASVDTLVEAIWEDPPAHPTKAVQVVVTRARAATDAAAIERTPLGYRLALDVADVDTWAARPEGLRLAAEGRYHDALPLLERAEPDDVVTEALLRAVAAVHGVPAALERYETYRAELSEQLGVDPGPALRALHSDLLARDRPVRTGLRYDATGLIGRDDDLAAITGRLRTSRVVSILGPGGLGKTRLAHLVGQRSEQPVVHFVELVGVATPEGVVGEVGTALGVRDSVIAQRVLTPEQRRDLRGRIAEHLQGPPTLLIVDNCEHVVDAVADLVAFLVTSVPELRVLTTSRAPLAIGAEQVYPLGQLGTADATLLFCQRAEAARSGAALPEEAVRSVVDRLDGLPLALELAAAKTRVMSVEDIAVRLADRFTLLRGGDRSAPDRHRTLWAVIDWSWALLREEERDAMGTLALFPDGFTLAAASSVLGRDALGTVEELVAQSLLAVQESAGRVRYRMLETVREFGLARLAEGGGVARARSAVRRWAVGYAAEHGAHLYDAGQVAAVAALRAEENNLADELRAALAGPEPDREAIVTLFSSLVGFWTIAADQIRAMTVAGSVVEALEGWDPPAELADRTRISLAVSLLFATVVGAPGTAELRKQLDTIGPPSTNPEIAALTRVTLAMSDPDQSAGRARVAEMAEDPDPRVAAVALRWQCHELENVGEPAAAIAAGERALALTDDSSGPWNAAVLHAQLCGLHAQLGDPPAAERHALAAYPVLERLGADDDVVQMKAVLAMAALDQDRLADAARIVDELELRTPQRGFGTAGLVFSARAQLALADGRVAEALGLHRDAIEAMGAIRLPPGNPGLGDLDTSPWVLVAESTALVNFAQFGAGTDGLDIVESLAGKLALILADGGRPLDFPVVGMILFGLGMWGVHHDPRPATEAARLLVLANRFGYHQFAPTMRWERAVAAAEQAAPGAVADAEAAYDDRRGPALLDEARAVAERWSGHILRE